MTPAEAAALQSAADEAGLARNEYARRTMLGHLSARGFAPAAPARGLRRVVPLEEAPREPIPLRAAAPSPAAPVAGGKLVSLDARPAARRASSAVTRPSVATNPRPPPPLAAPSIEPAPAPIEAAALETPRPSVATNGSAPPVEAPIDAPRREPREEHERRLDAQRAAAAPAEHEHRLEVRPASHASAAPPREEHERRFEAPAPVDADPDRALDAPPAPVDELAAPAVNETRLDALPVLSSDASTVLAAARRLAALDPIAPIAAPVLVLEVHVGGMTIEDARAAVLVLVTRGELAPDAGDDPSGLAPLDAFGRTITAVRIAPARET